jgi:hypothetical protein
MGDKIVIQIPVEYAVEIATYGETGEVSKFIQLFFEKQLKEKGLEYKVQEAREEKMQKMFKNLKRTLGDQNMAKLEDAIETGKQAIRVATRMNQKN